MWLSQLDRYIGRGIAISTAFVLVALLALLAFFTLLENLSELNKGNFTLPTLINFVLLSLPRKLYEAYPVVCLLGAIIGLSAMALNSELVVIRAAGVSMARLILSIFKTGTVIIAIGVGFGETIVPISEQNAQRIRAESMRDIYRYKDTGIWLRDGKTFMHVKSVLPDETLNDITVYEFDDNYQLLQQRTAQSAVYQGGEWRLQNVERTRYTDKGVHVISYEIGYLYITATPDVMRVFKVKPESLSIAHLYRYINHLEKSYQNTDHYRLVFWHKMLMPLAMAVMILLAMPFVFGQIRSGGMGQRVFIGILLGLGFIVINRGIGLFAINAGFPPLLGAVLPIALFFVLSMWLMRRLT